MCPDEPPPRQINPNALHSEWPHTDQASRIAGARRLNRREKTRLVAHDYG